MDEATSQFLGPLVLQAERRNILPIGVRVAPLKNFSMSLTDPAPGPIPHDRISLQETNIWFS